MAPWCEPVARAVLTMWSFRNLMLAELGPGVPLKGGAIPLRHTDGRGCGDSPKPLKPLSLTQNCSNLPMKKNGRSAVARLKFERTSRPVPHCFERRMSEG
jgi:hypothetical protein